MMKAGNERRKFSILCAHVVQYSSQYLEPGSDIGTGCKYAHLLEEHSIQRIEENTHTIGSLCPL